MGLVNRNDLPRKNADLLAVRLRMIERHAEVMVG